MKRRKKAKVLSFLLCLLLMFTTFTPMQITASAEDEDNNRNVIGDTVTVTQEGKTVITAPDNMNGELQWQYYSDEYKIWINIHGENGDICTLTYAKVYNMLDDNGQTQIRCTETTGETETISEPVTVILDNKQEEAEKSDEISNEETESDPVVINEVVENYAIATSSVENYDISDIQTYNETDSSETEEPTYKTYNIVINYVFTDGTTAASPYSATLSEGSSFHEVVNNPIVQGYLPHIGEEIETSDSVELNIMDINKDYTITVTYKPTLVEYTVIHYQQNVNNDNYTEVERETVQGQTESFVPEVENSYEGFYALLYEKPKIAADGSTVVEVYYDRYYYLMNFDLDGGYGVEPIYARYGTTIGDVGTPTKAGYTFKDWSLDGTTTVTLPTTMPAENCTYKAIWEIDDTAKVTIVIWGENANDEEYSYIKSSEIYATPGDTLDIASLFVCGMEAHSHTTSGCTLTCDHTSHTLDCYQTLNEYTLKEGKPDETITINGDGIYTYTLYGRTHYYLYLNGTWYCYYSNNRNDKSDTQRIRLSCSHEHRSDCYSCGLKEHGHSDSCYATNFMDSDLWTLVDSDEVKVSADGSTVMNIYYDRKEFTFTFKVNNNTVHIFTEKWGSDISDKWKFIGSNGVSYPQSNTSWEPQNSSTYTARITMMVTMPAESITFTHTTSNNTTRHFYYYVESLPGEDGERVYNGTNYDLYLELVHDFNIIYYNDDFFILDGYTRDVITTENGTDIGLDPNENTSWENSWNSKLYFYYDRNTYTLDFNDGYEIDKSESVKYKENLGKYDYTPELPTELYESGSRTFDGWYLNPECTGTEYDLSSHTMPGANLILYAKWEKVTHNVRLFTNYEDASVGTNQIGEAISVQHGSKVDTIPEIPVTGIYNFVGWFYMDGNTEKAFDFENMPITKDMDVYAKWSSNILKQYFIYYKLKGTDTEIAAPTVGSALAGISKTFDAKGGSELYAGYQEGYFPETKSHTITIDIDDDGNNIYTFWYVEQPAVPYTVKYINKETGETLVAEKVVSDNRKAVVTETFVPVSGYMPDAYQKRLVVNYEQNAVNEIIFYYTEDTEHAYYRISHNIENIDGGVYTEYQYIEAIGNINGNYKGEAISIPGFIYNEEKSEVIIGDRVEKGTEGILTSDGLEIKLYYDRKTYPYEVRFLEQGSEEELHKPKEGSDKYGNVISMNAINIPGYECVTSSPQTLTIKIEEGDNAKLNVITFYYKEKVATINYVAIGPANSKDFGSVSLESETIKIKSGTAVGSTPEPGENFQFVGWYIDEACTQPVTEENGTVDANNKFIPARTGENRVYEAATYYAKFDYAVVDLTIEKTGADDIDKDQNFIFRVTGSSGIDLLVTIVGNGSITIKDLPVGTYTITEESDWSWRYSTNSSYKDIEVTTNKKIIFENSKKCDKWLDGNAYIRNKFTGISN